MNKTKNERRSLEILREIADTFGIDLEPPKKRMWNESIVPDDYTVERIEEFDNDGRFCGSRIEPPLSSIEDANDLDRLRWNAAVVGHDSGIKIKVGPGRQWTNGKVVTGVYDIYTKNGTLGAGDFHSAWSVLIGISLGAEAVREERKEQERNGN